MRTTRITFEFVHSVTKPGAYGAEALPPHQQSYVAATTAANGWKSPVPYLFGGLAAMLGLIAFALLILACSYWKLSGRMDSGENSGDDDGGEKVKEAAVFANSVLVIMAGEEKPTFLATPAATSNKTTSFWDSQEKPSCSCSCSSTSSSESGDVEERDDVQLTTMTTTTNPPDEEKRGS